MAQNLIYYTVDIAGVDGSAPADGFIDNLSASSYVAPGAGETYNMEVGWPADLAGALARARGNLRWTNIVSQLSSTVTPYSISNIVATGASNTDPATSMDFVVVYDRPDYLYAYDELNPGAILYNQYALTRWIARALVATINVDNYDVLDPTAFSNPDFHYGESLLPVTAGPLAADIPTAEGLVTVTFMAEISGTLAYPLT